MAVTSTYSIDLVPKATPVVVGVSQYDEGRQITFNVYNNGVAFNLSGYSASIVINTRSTRVATITSSVSGSTIRFSTTAASTLYPGRHMAELRVMRSSGEYVGSTNFVWEVEQSPENDFVPTAEEENTFASMLRQSQQASSSAQSYAAQAQASAEGLAYLANKRYIFIGDSYGAGYGLSDTSQNWINVVVNRLNLTSGNYYKSAVSASGFIGWEAGTPTFLQQLQTLKSSVSSPGTITDIVVCGGWNDGGSEGLEIREAMRDFTSYVRANFQKAKVHIGMISWCDVSKRYTVKNETNSRWNIRNALDSYRWAGGAGAAYIPNSEYILHNMAYFQSDGLHPNVDGQYAVGEHIASYLLGGGIDVFRYTKVDFTKDSTVTGSAPDVFTLINNGQVGMVFVADAGPSWSFNSRSITGAGFGTTQANTITLGTFGNDHIPCRGGNYSELSWYGQAYFRVGGSWQMHNVMLRLGDAAKGRSKVLEAAMIGTTGGSYTSISNVTEMWIPVPWLWLRADSMMC